MTNTQDGGRIIFGVQDSDFALIGMSEQDFTSFDQTKINDLIHKYAEPPFSCQVHKLVVDHKRVVVIDVAEFPDVPVLCKRDANSSKDSSKLLLREGQLYIRTDKGSSEAVASAQDMREVLGRALSKTGDALLANIERLLKGKPPAVRDHPTEEYRQEIEEAEGYIAKVIGEELKKHGSWNICIYPHTYDPRRISEHRVIKDLISRAEVDLRGWNFPHTDAHGNATNFLKGTQSYTIWNHFVEAYRAYQSGLFIWSGVFSEDKDGREVAGNPVLSFVSVIWFFTELILFVRRYYGEVAPNDELRIEAKLNGTEGRMIVPPNSSIFLRGDYISHEDTIVLKEDVHVVNVRASFKEIANVLARRVFAVFNWDEITERVVDDWQTKLIERRC